jgi:ABC-type nickel/cobalt efflux system permease component RcnA
MDDLLRFGTALLLGLFHSIDVDHAVAASTVVSGRPAWPMALRYGLQWGLGHSVAVLLAGVALLGFGVRISARFERIAELGVGILLIVLGALALRTLGKLHLHRPPAHGDHAHLHAHGSAAPHDHLHAHADPSAVDQRHHPSRPLVVGLVHGLAGSSGALALIPVTLIGSWMTGILYLVAFGLGVTAGMALFALGLAEAIRRASGRSMLWGRRIGRGLALLGLVTGGWWILK